jgi:metal transporter CNNM
MASSIAEQACLAFNSSFLYSSPHSISSLELKELIALHSHGALHGGDLKTDTVTIIGATLDLQEKVVKQVSPDATIHS